MNGCLKVLSGSGESVRDEIRKGCWISVIKPRAVFMENQTSFRQKEIFMHWAIIKSTCHSYFQDY